MLPVFFLLSVGYLWANYNLSILLAQHFCLWILIVIMISALFSSTSKKLNLKNALFLHFFVVPVVVLMIKCIYIVMLVTGHFPLWGNLVTTGYSLSQIAWLLLYLNFYSFKCFFAAKESYSEGTVAFSLIWICYIDIWKVKSEKSLIVFIDV